LQFEEARDPSISHTKGCDHNTSQGKASHPKDEITLSEVERMRL